MKIGRSRDRERGLHHLKKRSEKRDRWRDMEKNKKGLEDERDRERDHHNDIGRDASVSRAEMWTRRERQGRVKLEIQAKKERVQKQGRMR